MNLDTEKIEKRVKRAKLLSEIMMGLAVFNCFCSVILVTTMYQMGNRMTVLSQLFNTTRGTDTMFYSSALDSRVENIRSLEWAFVQKYIEEKVFSIPDPKEMYRRWGVYGNLSTMSHRRVWRPTYKDSDEKLKNIDMTLPVHAENIRYISDLGHHWTALYDECTQNQGGNISCVPKRVNIEIRFFANKRQFAPYPGIYYNPFGMAVYHWQETNA